MAIESFFKFLDEKENRNFEALKEKNINNYNYFFVRSENFKNRILLRSPAIFSESVYIIPFHGTSSFYFLFHGTTHFVPNPYFC